MALCELGTWCPCIHLIIIFLGLLLTSDGLLEVLRKGIRIATGVTGTQGDCGGGPLLGALRLIVESSLMISLGSYQGERSDLEHVFSKHESKLQITSPE